MKYLVLKQFGNERKLKRSENSTTLSNGAESVTISRHFLSGNAKKSRRFRSAFTTEQIQYLEREYKKFPYIGSGNRKEVSNVLNIPERAVKIWFQNRRMKEKKEVASKETAEEEQKKINTAPQGQSSMHPLNHQANGTHTYAACQYKYKPIYPDPCLTKASIKHLNGNKNMLAHDSSTSIQDKPRITVKNFNNRNLTETSNPRIINKVAPVASRPLNNNAYVPMNIVQNKNICTTKLTEQLQTNQKGHGIMNQENPKDLTIESQNSVIHPNFYQMNANQDQRYPPLHVQTLPQPPPFVPGNILWKPVNMMGLPGIPSSQVVHNKYTLMHRNFPRDCKCNCGPYSPQEIPPLVQIDGRLLQSPYVIAMPFNHCDRI